MSSLEREVVRRILIKKRFQTKRAQVHQAFLDRYACASAQQIIKSTTDDKLVIHARNLGLSPQIIGPYEVAGAPSRGLARQAADYLRLWLEFDKYFNQMIDKSVSKKFSRDIEYDYYEHLSR